MQWCDCIDQRLWLTGLSCRYFVVLVPRTLNRITSSPIKKYYTHALTYFFFLCRFVFQVEREKEKNVSIYPTKYTQQPSSYFFAHTRRHCSTIAHFLHKWATRRNGCNWRTGWMQLHRHNSISLSHSKFVSVLRNGKMFFFRSARPVWLVKVLFYSRMWLIDWLRLWKWKSHFFVPDWSRTNENRVLSIFQHVENLWMKKLNGVVSVQLHPPSQPIARIPPSRPFMGKWAMVLQWRRVRVRK